MHRNYGFAGPCSTAHHGWTVVITIGQFALFRVQENTPALQTFLKHTAELRFAFRNEYGLPALVGLDELLEGRFVIIRNSRGRVLFGHPSHRIDFFFRIAGGQGVQDLIAQWIKLIFHCF